MARNKWRNSWGVRAVDRPDARYIRALLMRVSKQAALSHPSFPTLILPSRDGPRWHWFLESRNSLLKAFLSFCFSAQIFTQNRVWKDSTEFPRPVAGMEILRNTEHCSISYVPTNHCDSLEFSSGQRRPPSKVMKLRQNDSSTSCVVKRRGYGGCHTKRGKSWATTNLVTPRTQTLRFWSTATIHCDKPLSKNRQQPTRYPSEVRSPLDPYGSDIVRPRRQECL